MAGGGNESIFMVVNATTDTDPDLWEVGRRDSREFTMVLLQSRVEGPRTPEFHFSMVSATQRSQAVSKTRLTITASGFGCP
ncbi:hypothetical protein KbCgl_19760 [Corynebacterium glutamicum]|nr:hypothetical protein KbCgl_19760 [Corynebacterium glutamicum]